MSLTFQNAPLVELIAELRWNPAGVQTAFFQGPQPVQQDSSGQPRVFFMNNPNVEGFLQTLAGELYQKGYRRTERMLPFGFPPPPYQQVSRFRSDVEDKSSTLYQAGFGIFSANAFPPYDSWDNFAPVVADGIEALLIARDQADRDAPFGQLSLRYVDAFREPLTEGRDVASFLADALGFSVNIPKVLQGHIAKGQREKPSVMLAVPLENGMRMDLTIGEGAFNGEPAILMETTVATAEPIAPTNDAVMSVFNDARHVIHDVFCEITKPIHHIMKPKGNDS